jgi:hypothetical protein
MVGDLEKSSFSNIEQQSLEFVMYTSALACALGAESGAALFSNAEKPRCSASST